MSSIRPLGGRSLNVSAKCGRYTCPIQVFLLAISPSPCIGHSRPVHLLDIVASRFELWLLLEVLLSSLCGWNKDLSEYFGLSLDRCISRVTRLGLAPGHEWLGLVFAMYLAEPSVDDDDGLASCRGLTE
ncbi:unnamed protein product [Cochlearia groenlandica]